MTDEQTHEPESMNAGHEEDEEEFEEILDPTDALETAHDTLARFLDSAGVEAVYGEPVQNGDIIVIPSAEVVSAMGFGVGVGWGGDDENGGSGGSGGGGGGRVLARPVAAIVISPEDARVEPIIDFTKIALGALTAAGFMLAMVMRMSRPRIQDALED